MIEHLSRLIAKSLYNNTAEKSSSEEIEMLQYGIAVSYTHLTLPTTPYV